MSDETTIDDVRAQLRAERDALAAQVARVEAVMGSWPRRLTPEERRLTPGRNDYNDAVDQCRNAIRRALSGDAEGAGR